jgi:hypothetical protein
MLLSASVRMVFGIDTRQVTTNARHCSAALIGASQTMLVAADWVILVPLGVAERRPAESGVQKVQKACRGEQS